MDAIIKLKNNEWIRIFVTLLVFFAGGMAKDEAEDYLNKRDQAVVTYYEMESYINKNSPWLKERELTNYRITLNSQSSEQLSVIIADLQKNQIQIIEQIKELQRRK